MKPMRSGRREGSVMLWVVLILTVAVGAYLVFGVLRLHEFRDRIDQAMGKKPVRPMEGNEGVLFVHQEHLRQQAEGQEKLAGAITELQARADAERKQAMREMRQMEMGMGDCPPPAPAPAGTAAQETAATPARSAAEAQP